MKFFALHLSVDRLFLYSLRLLFNFNCLGFDEVLRDFELVLVQFTEEYALDFIVGSSTFKLGSFISTLRRMVTAGGPISIGALSACILSCLDLFLLFVYSTGEDFDVITRLGSWIERKGHASPCSNIMRQLLDVNFFLNWIKQLLTRLMRFLTGARVTLFYRSSSRFFN